MSCLNFAKDNNQHSHHVIYRLNADIETLTCANKIKKRNSKNFIYTHICHCGKTSNSEIVLRLKCDYISTFTLLQTGYALNILLSSAVHHQLYILNKFKCIKGVLSHFDPVMCISPNLIYFIYCIDIIAIVAM